MKRRRTPDLAALQEQFRLQVVFAGDPDGAALPCWFADQDERACDGPREAAHFIARQVIRNRLWAHGADADWTELAEWDPRNAVCSCHAHHRRFDLHLTPSLVVGRESVPEAVQEFAAEKGLELALEDRCPVSISAERTGNTVQSANSCPQCGARYPTAGTCHGFGAESHAPRRTV